jgi:hypothetical protein
MQFPGRRPPPPQKPNQFVFDSDMGNRIDSALALAVVLGHVLRNEADSEVAAVGTSKAYVDSAAFLDVLRRFYARPTLPAEGEGGAPGRGPQPITANRVGYRMDGNTPESTPLIDAVVGKKGTDGALIYSREVDRISKTADSVALLRDTVDGFREAGDVPGVGVFIETGPATNLARLLHLSKMAEGIEEKVRLLVVAMGRYPTGPDAVHIGPDVAGARKLFAEWPGPIVAVGAEVGERIQFPASSIEKDFAWAPNHPIVDAYRAYKPMPYDAAAWETAAALYAVQPDAGYFKLSATGRIAIGEDGAASFEEAADGKHRYLIVDESKRAETVAAMAKLASTEPSPASTPAPPPAV